jgi:hypothetical protein
LSLRHHQKPHNTLLTPVLCRLVFADGIGIFHKVPAFDFVKFP